MRLWILDSLRLSRVIANQWPKCVVVCAVAGLAGSPSVSLSQEREPLLMEGKKTLYQRVLTRPGAQLRDAPASESVLKRLEPFLIYYVYAREQVADSEWVEVSPSSRGSTSGWIAGSDVIDWKQMLTVAFTNPANRHPTLFFSKREPLSELLESEMGPGEAAELRKIVFDQSAKETPVVAIEPEKHIDLRENFYLLPILEHFEADDDYYTKLLKVAVVNKDLEAVAQQDTQRTAKDIPDFKVGIAFVLDSTISMAPYIERARQAVRRICAKTQDLEWRDDFSFALIAFRDSLEPTPDLEYTRKLFADFADGQDCATFLQKVERVEEARVSSKGFAEDSFSGVHMAINDIDWGPYAARYVVLVTDASGRSGKDRYSQTKLNAKQLNQLAYEKGIAILTLHLLTPAGVHDHGRAAEQYTRVSYFRDARPLYYGVEAGAVEAFGNAVDDLANFLIAQLTTAREQQAQEEKQIAEVTKSDILQKLDVEIVGRAMRLAYLGRIEGTRAPDVFQAWIAERDLEDPRRKPVEVRVLLTKDQLSDLQDRLRRIKVAGDLTDLSPEDFFGQVRSLLAGTLRDPSELGNVQSLGDANVLGEYLEGLPYQSSLTRYDEDEWLAMGPGRRQEIIDDIESKIELYQELHDDTDLWIATNEERIKGEALYPMLLDALP